MKKYLETLLIIPIFLLSLPVAFFILLNVPDRFWGCQGFGCLGLILAIPYLTILFSIPLTMVVYLLLRISIGKDNTNLKNKILHITKKVTHLKYYKTALFILTITFAFGAVVLLTASVLSCHIKTKYNKPSPGFSLNERYSITPSEELYKKTTSTPALTISSDSTNWKTYKNEKYGFEFKYPQEWTVLDTDYGADIVDAENRHLITLNAINNITDLDKFFNNQKNDPGFKTVTLYPIRHQGFTSLHQTLINEYSTDTQHHVWIKYDSTLYEFTFLVDNPKDIEYATQIISSFSFFDIFRNNLFNTNVLAQIPELTLPNGLEFVQLAYPQKLNGVYYVFFRKHNMNNPINSSVSRSGVLYTGKNDTSWKIFFEIKELNNERNNPYFFWKENDYFYVILIDANGGGSGEGLGKLIKINSTDNRWHVIDCFYYVPESFGQFINLTSTDVPLSKQVENYNKPSEGVNSVYIFDKKVNVFLRDNVVQKSCTSFELEF